MKVKEWIRKQSFEVRVRFQKMMKCIWSGERLRIDEAVDSSESLATRDHSASGYSSRAGEVETKIDNSNIEEAESSLRESGYLNYEEARALLGRLEFQKGNIEAALHVFEGIDIAAVTSKMKVSLSRRSEEDRCRSQSDTVPTMSLHAVSLLFEAIFLKAKSLQGLGRFAEAAQTCKVILETVESALPEGIPENISADRKLHEILNKAVELLPELWTVAGAPQEAILSYRRALLYNWNLDTETMAKIQKEFAVFLLYSGCDASPPNLRSQMESSFGPRNNLEEAILLLLILLRKIGLKKIGWDTAIMDHLCFALSVSGDLVSLAHHIEKLLPQPEIMNRRKRYSTLAFCYHGEGEHMVALNLLKNLLNNRENPDCVLELLLASKICGENSVFIEEGINYAYKAISELRGRCSRMFSVANCLLGILLSAQSRSVSSDSERVSKQFDALEMLETADRIYKYPYILYHLCVENAEQRKLEVALHYAKQLLKLEAGSSVKGFILLARILSAQKRFVDAETVLNAALDQTSKWDQGDLLRTKAKLQIAQGQLKNAIETYTHLLAVLHVRNKSLGTGKKLLKNKGNHDRSLETETWNDLANIYTSLSQWRDAEVCLSRSKVISPYSAFNWHSAGLLCEAKGQYQEALKSFKSALDVEPTHIPSLISMACLLKQLGSSQSTPVIRSLLTDALRLDRTNPSAWYHLGLLYKADESASALEAVECFEAAAALNESAPIEPFR